MELAFADVIRLSLSRVPSKFSQRVAPQLETRRRGVYNRRTLSGQIQPAEVVADERIAARAQLRGDRGFPLTSAPAENDRRMIDLDGAGMNHEQAALVTKSAPRRAEQPRTQ